MEGGRNKKREGIKKFNKRRQEEGIQGKGGKKKKKKKSLLLALNLSG